MVTFLFPLLSLFLFLILLCSGSCLPSLPFPSPSPNTSCESPSSFSFFIFYHFHFPNFSPYLPFLLFSFPLLSLSLAGPRSSPPPIPHHSTPIFQIDPFHFVSFYFFFFISLFHATSFQFLSLFLLILISLPFPFLLNFKPFASQFHFSPLSPFAFSPFFYKLGWDSAKIASPFSTLGMWFYSNRSPTFIISFIHFVVSPVPTQPSPPPFPRS